MFQPNVLCSLTQTAGTTDVFGNAIYNPSRPAKCGIVKLNVGDQNVTVRADSSASRGAAQEIVADAVLLFPVIYGVKGDDIIDVIGYRLKVTKTFPRHNVNGQLDHIQVEAMIWQ
jgi:hypothetical protein